MKKHSLIIGILLFTILVLSVVRIFISNNVSTSGVVLGKIQEDIDKYKFQNSIIAEKLYLTASLTNISNKAYDSGYIDSKKELVLNKQVPVAIKQ